MIRKLKKALTTGRAEEPSSALSGKTARLLVFARQSPEAALAELRADARGLSREAAEDRRLVHGRNVIAEEKPTPWPVQLLRAGNNPFIYLLMVLGGVSYATGDMRAAIVMGAMILVSVLLRFMQEFRSSKAASKLKAMVSSTATVLRREYVTRGSELDLSDFPTPIEVPLDALVPGDVVRLAAGDMIPADVRLLSSKDLFISQAALTGESLPVEKADQLPADLAEEPDPLHLPTLCFMGSNVASGTATALVVATGSRTYLGSLAKTLMGQRVVTSFDKGVSRISWLLIRFMGVMVPIVFILNGATKHDWKDAFLFAISVAVGLTPEMLPMIVTSNLAKGAMAMAKRKVVVKRLSAIQNFGAMDILCTDKTGTLTQDEVYLERHIDLDGEESLHVIQRAYLNSFYQTGLKNQLDRAVLKHVELNQEMTLDRTYRKVDEIPFDFERRRMSVVVDQEGLGQVLVCKGAVEELLKICTRFELNGVVEEITEEVRERAKALVKAYNADGFRVVAVAQRVAEARKEAYGVQDERDLVLLGFLAFLDPPKESAGPAIRALRDYGVAVKILTGDNATVTRKVCKEVGLPVERIVLGAEIDALDEAALGALAEEVAVFAKLNPMQKSRIIQALRAKGHCVGYMGDGINDAGALREADIGISVDTAVDIAKESADIILLEKSLMVLEEGIVEGRKIFANIQKYLKMTASSNFGNVFSVLGASALLPFLPMLPIQLLINNLLYDFSQIAIPWDRVDEEYLKVPRRWDSSDLTRFMVWIGPLSSVFDYATFGVMWWVFKANADVHQGLFQSGWFIESLLSQTLIVHLLRTAKVPFIQSRASAPLLLSTFTLMAIGLVIPFTSFGRSVGMAALPLAYFGWLALILLGYCVLVQAVKAWYERRFGAWL
jgi:Mg2+-importing ATPase